MNDLNLETRTPDVQSNGNPTSCSTVMPKIAKQIFEPTPGNDFKGEDTPEWARKLYLEPLLEGWRREVVTRAIQTTTKSTIDIYYWSPEGRKLRSRPELAEYLSENEITKFSAMFNFSFARRAFGNEFAPYEIVRKAGSGSSGRPRFQHAKSKHQAWRPLKRKQKAFIGKKNGGNEENFTKGLPFMLTGDDILPEKEENSVIVYPRSNGRGKKRKLSSSNSERGNPGGTPERKLYCVCNDVEKGQMILCDNSECEIGWYHFECVGVLVDTDGPWYCPFCRGPTHSVINPLLINNENC